MTDHQYEGLLEYDAVHRILVCTQCRYAIQPKAIARHLKDLHHIYRGQRKDLVDSTTNLELSDPVGIAVPPPDSPPIQNLPVDDGLACNDTDCGHLCVTTKRMKRHWVTKHGTVGVEGINWRAVKIQTFFRGAHLRYFIVNPTNNRTQQPGSLLHVQQDSAPAQSTNVSAGNNKPPTLSNETTLTTRLLDHYTTVTYKTLVQREEGQEFWRTSVLQLAQQHTFVMHGLLAISAFHLAWLNPVYRYGSIVTATQHQNQALHLYQAAVDHPNENNCHALFAFASILVVLEFAAQRDRDDLLFLESTDERDGLPAWLHLVRGGCSLLGFLWPQIATGPMKPLIGKEDGEADITQSTDDPHLAALLPLFSSDSDILGADSAELDVCTTALEILRWVFSLPYIDPSSFTYRYVIQLWPAKVPQAFIGLLNDYRPGALILLAYYCVLVKRTQGCWYLQGRADQLMGLVQAKLDAHLMAWVQWPLQVMESLDRVEETFWLEDG